MHGAIFFALKPCITGWGIDASLRDSNYVAAAFSFTKATYSYALVRLPAELLND